MSELVPDAQIFPVEQATLPTLPAIEVIAVTSERVGDGPMVRHELSVEITVAHATADGCDEALDAIVRAVRQRLDAAERQEPEVSLANGEGCLCVLGATRWSVSASAASSVIRGAAVAVSGMVSE